MAYFRKLDAKLQKLQELLNKNERWLILINADPDALASALALKRILAGKVEQVGIAHVNEISRPDNLAMIRLLRIPTKKLKPRNTQNVSRRAPTSRAKRTGWRYRRV